jgi:hypothetical protein
MGSIYILTNHAYSGVKIGCTAKHPSLRAKELFTTGVPAPFRVFEHWEVPDNDMYTVEKELHKYLRRFRNDRNREFFDLSPPDAKEHILSFLSEYTDIIEKLESAERRSRAIYAWGSKSSDAWRGCCADAECKLGYTFDSLQIPETGWSNFVGCLFFVMCLCTLCILPIVMALLRIDLEDTPKKRLADNRRNELQRCAEELYKQRRKEYFNSHGIFSLTDDELKSVKDVQFVYDRFDAKRNIYDIG